MKTIARAFLSLGILLASLEVHSGSFLIWFKDDERLHIRQMLENEKSDY